MPEKRRVAVLASNAFSAAHFVDLLLEDPSYSVLGVSRSAEYPDCMLAYKRHQRPDFRFARLDMNRELPQILAELDAFKPDYVVNFAAQGEVASSFAHPEDHYQTNTLGMVRLTNALRTRDWLKRYVHISTPEVYGTCEGRITEEQRFNPSSPYAASKAGADLHNTVLAKTYGFPVVTIRATNVYGPHQQLYRIIPRTAIYIKMGRKLTLHGGGKAVKSYIHIRDVSEGEKVAMLSGRAGETYHLSPDGDGISVRTVVETVCEVMGRRFEDCVEMGEDRIGQDKAYIIDSTRARQELDWRPRIAFRDGVCETIEWIERDWDAIRTLPLDYQHIAS
jgi:dTDP-glucose 4,6-dehydratase